MHLFVISLHIILCIAMILIILLQPGKGGDVGAAFGGGGGGSMFGPRGPASLLSKATTGAAVMFMVTSVSLAWYSNKASEVGDDDYNDEDEEQFFGVPGTTPEEGDEPPAPLAPSEDDSEGEKAPQLEE